MKSLSTTPNLEFFKREISPAELQDAATAKLPSVVAALTAPTVAALPERVDERRYPQADREAYLAAIQTLVGSGGYSNLVNIHVEMSHDMHGRMFMDNGTTHASATGVQRFLAWHRAYLLEFEKLLQAIRPGLRIPYWRWSAPGATFPAWLAGYLPAGLRNAAGQSHAVTRQIGANGGLPGRDPILALLRHTSYTPFTLALEGWQPYGAHNQVHVYVSGTMGSAYSPADPVFWLHHAEIDRLWHIWQVANPGKGPTLSGSKRIMDPWPHRVEDLTSIATLGYAYDDSTV